MGIRSNSRIVVERVALNKEYLYDPQPSNFGGPVLKFQLASFIPSPLSIQDNFPIISL
jgi:hypothetical protein